MCLCRQHAAGAFGIISVYLPPHQPLDPSFSSLSLFPPNTFNPPVSPHPSFVCRALSADLDSSVSPPLSVCGGGGGVKRDILSLTRHACPAPMMPAQRRISRGMCHVAGGRAGGGRGQMDRADRSFSPLPVTSQWSRRQLCLLLQMWKSICTFNVRALVRCSGTDQMIFTLKSAPDLCSLLRCVCLLLPFTFV